MATQQIETDVTAGVHHLTLVFEYGSLDAMRKDHRRVLSDIPLDPSDPLATRTVAWATGDKLSAYDDLLSALKECALQIAQNNGRKLTADEEIALDFARRTIAKATA